MNRIIILFVAVLLLLNVFGCSRINNEDDQLPEATVSPSPVVEVANDETTSVVDNTPIVSPEVDENVGADESRDSMTTTETIITPAPTQIPLVPPAPEPQENEQNIFEGSAIEGEIGL